MSISVAIEIAGSAGALARKIGISDQRLTNWRNRGIPADQVIRVSAAVDYRVTPHDLRPDIYPNASDGIPSNDQAKQ